MSNIGFIEALMQDVRYGLRVLWKSPAVSLVSVLSLALGIAATTAIFSVVYGVLIAPYPYARPEQIWAPEIHNAKRPQERRRGYVLSEYLAIKRLPAFSGVMAT